MTLNLHSGGELVPYEALRELETPVATPSHVPIPHYRLIDLVRGTLSMYGHEIVEEHHALDHDNMRYFGLLSLRSPYTGYTDTLGLRNSHDRSFPVGIGIGARVFVCSNLSFLADTVIKRKHTANLKRDLPGIIGEIIEPLADQRERQHRTFERYKRTMLTDQMADHAIMQMWREGIINIQRIPEVIGQWENPAFPEFAENRNIWRLFNAATYALTGRVVENANITPRLHQVIDGVCEHIQ
jgi:hypothetical protein